jgi:hypothetical protein
MERPIVYIKRALVEISAVIAGFALFVIATAILTTYLFRGGREGTLTLPTDFVSWLPFFVVANSCLRNRRVATPQIATP